MPSAVGDLYPRRCSEVENRAVGVGRWRDGQRHRTAVGMPVWEKVLVLP